MLRLKSGAGDTWAGWAGGEGYVQLRLSQGGAWGELLVDPAARRRGLGRHLLGACLEAARQRGAGHLDIWCFGDRESGARLAAEMGFAPLRRLLLQVRSLEELPDLPPAEVELQPFQEQDVADWMAVQNAWSEESFRLRLAEPWFEPSLLRLARHQGRTLGYLWLKPEGEIFMMAVSPRARGRGLGRWLVTWGLHELARRGAQRASVFVDAGSEEACRLYAGLGFTTHSADCCYRRELA